MSLKPESSYQTIHTLTDSQFQDLYDLFKSVWWANQRQPADIRQMVENSSLIIALQEPDTGRLVAFSRLLSDGIYRATIYDVIVAEDLRGQGIGPQLMDAILNHPAVQAVEQLGLTCLSEMVPYYQKWHFTDQMGDVKLMRRSC